MSQSHFVGLVVILIVFQVVVGVQFYLVQEKISLLLIEQHKLAVAIKENSKTQSELFEQIMSYAEEKGLIKDKVFTSNNYRFIDRGTYYSICEIGEGEQTYMGCLRIDKPQLKDVFGG